MSGVPPPNYDFGATPSHEPKRKRSLLPLILILGCGGAFFLCAIGSAILFAVIAEAKLQAQLKECKRNMDSVGEAIEAYVADHGDTYPKAETWSKDIEPYVAKDSTLKHHCPMLQGDHSLGAGYAFNFEFAGKKLNKAPDDQPILVEVDDPRRNAIWKEGESYTTSRHQNGKYYFAYFYSDGARRYEVGGPFIPVE